MQAPLGQLVDLAIGASGGFVAAMVALRTRFALQDQRESIAAKIAADAEGRLHKRLDEIERRQLASLRLLAEVATKLGLDHRFSDTLIRFLAESGATRGD